MPFLSSSGISVLNIIRGGAAGEVVPLLLDLYPATAAYSLRKLKASYTGDAIKVRIDTTGHPTYDIGFDSNGELDTADLLSKAAGNDAYVTTWYDQSGNGNNATNLAAASQPRIVNAGSLETNNGVAAIYFDGSGDTLTFDNINTYAAFIVENVTIVGGFGLLGSTANSNIIGDLNYFNGRIRLNNANYDFAVSNTDNALTVLNRSSNDYSYFVNSNASTNNPRTIAFDMNLNAMMNRQGIFFYEGYLNEIIIYNSDQSANISSIENNINTYYQIYWDGSQTGLLDTYPASAAYSLRALSSEYTGAAIRVRRSSDNSERDIGLLYDGSLDTADLLSFTGAGDGFVKIWYDQSGNGNDATNLTASKQPQIVSSGSVITSGSIPAIQSISGSRLDTAAVSMGSSRGYFLVMERLGAAFSGGGAYHNLVIQGASPFYQLYIPNSDSELNYYDGAVRDTGDIIPTSQVLNTVSQNSSSGTIRLNGTEILALGSGASALNSAFSFMGYSSFASNAYFSEIIIYNSDESSNITAIETNINDYYSIYP